MWRPESVCFFHHARQCRLRRTHTQVRKLPRIFCIHAMQSSVTATKAAFEADFPKAKIFNLLDDSLAVDVEVTGLDAAMHSRFLALSQYAAFSKADAILFTCSAFGSAIEAAQRQLHASIPVLKPNEGLQQEVVERGGRIGVLSMFAPTLPSICREIDAMATVNARPLTLESLYVADALSMLQHGQKRECAHAIASSAVQLCHKHPDIETLALAMFSMAFAQDAVEAALTETFPSRRIAVLTSPRSAVSSLKKVLMDAN